jgi:hypothetical protein
MSKVMNNHKSSNDSNDEHNKMPNLHLHCGAGPICVDPVMNPPLSTERGPFHPSAANIHENTAMNPTTTRNIVNAKTSG